MQRIVVEGKKFCGTHTGGSIALGSIARDLLLQRVEIQHQVRYICMSIHMIMMENLLLMSVPELSMKDIKKYYGKNHVSVDIDQCEAYYEGFGGTRKRRIYGLGSQAQSYYGPNLCVNFAFNAYIGGTFNFSIGTYGKYGGVSDAIDSYNGDRLLPLFIEKARE
ncbi:uncharacterized protein LOC132046089 [Lycium ferocissimum]|uniref:uncharacterized protein LOC132046089 n=1 Tax=Lycium ferocissimum TaxID=112874 RepID=UPI002814C7F3|nr:uncharacterized protein LOC132046089 [Lycium ferocissimum]